MNSTGDWTGRLYGTWGPQSARDAHRVRGPRASRVATGVTDWVRADHRRGIGPMYAHAEGLASAVCLLAAASAVVVAAPGQTAETGGSPARHCRPASGHLLDLRQLGGKARPDVPLYRLRGGSAANDVQEPLPQVRRELRALREAQSEILGKKQFAGDSHQNIGTAGSASPSFINLRGGQEGGAGIATVEHVKEGSPAQQGGGRDVRPITVAPCPCATHIFQCKQPHICYAPLTHCSGSMHPPVRRAAAGRRDSQRWSSHQTRLARRHHLTCWHYSGDSPAGGHAAVHTRTHTGTHTRTRTHTHTHTHTHIRMDYQHESRAAHPKQVAKHTAMRVGTQPSLRVFAMR